ncbi:hypothetical protein [Leptospira jelokensis]|uniref:ASCH domain-containing protein n=1 Tax=Leptospira jelokensis TaxID=2484931 RepID=A0A4Z0ZNK4_9LEPT|nr:hypothetical protein [Leptospira jelokensis]TGL58596.1 hypothetical protein EHQ62_17015 [Leptospira jelokensis]
MILGFSTKFPCGGKERYFTNFVPKILDGRKLHTFRKGSRWKAGDKIHFAIGVRTKNYHQFATGKVTSVFKTKINPKSRSISFYFKGSGYVKIKPSAIDKLAKDDGFASTEDFWKLFKEPFTGQLIIWELD